MLGEGVELMPSNASSVGICTEGQGRAVVAQGLHRAQSGVNNLGKADVRAPLKRTSVWYR